MHLVATLMELGKLIPSKTKDTARRVVQKVVDELIEKLEQKTISALTGALNRSSRNRRPRQQRDKLGRNNPQESETLSTGI